jgi:hypothetical protein
MAKKRMIAPVSLLMLGVGGLGAGGYFLNSGIKTAGKLFKEMKTINNLIPKDIFDNQDFKNILENFRSNRLYRIPYNYNGYIPSGLLVEGDIFHRLNREEILELLNGTNNEYKLGHDIGSELVAIKQDILLKARCDLNDCYVQYINELNPSQRTPEMDKFLELYSKQSGIETDYHHGMVVRNYSIVAVACLVACCVGFAIWLFGVSVSKCLKESEVFSNHKS